MMSQESNFIPGKLIANKFPGYDPKLHLMARFHFWRSGASEKYLFIVFTLMLTLFEFHIWVKKFCLKIIRIQLDSVRKNIKINKETTPQKCNI